MRNIWILVLALAGCAAVQNAPVPDSRNRVVDIVNTTAMPLQFRAVRAENKRWGPRVSFSETIAPNYYQTINFYDGSGACLFTFYVEFQDGSTRPEQDVNTCEVASWVVN